MAEPESAHCLNSCFRKGRLEKDEFCSQELVPGVEPVVRVLGFFIKDGKLWPSREAGVRTPSEMQLDHSRQRV